MPAGARLKYRSNIPLYSNYVFEPVDDGFPGRAAALRDSGRAAFIVAGYSYGQGSSREHAAICPMYLGVRAVLALSIERIHQANLCNFGILPLQIRSEEDYRALAMGDSLVIEDAVEQVRKAPQSKTVSVKDVTNGRTFELTLDISPLQAEMLVCGGRLNQIREALK